MEKKTLLDLAYYIEGMERKIAPGSETIILGDFVRSYDYVSSIIDDQTSLDINTDVTDIYQDYVDAYKALT